MIIGDIIFYLVLLYQIYQLICYVFFRSQQNDNQPESQHKYYTATLNENNEIVYDEIDFESSKTNKNLSS